MLILMLTIYSVLSLRLLRLFNSWYSREVFLHLTLCREAPQLSSILPLIIFHNFTTLVLCSFSVLSLLECEGATILRMYKTSVSGVSRTMAGNTFLENQLTIGNMVANILISSEFGVA